MAMNPRMEPFQVKPAIPQSEGGSEWIQIEEASQLAGLHDRIQTIARLLLEGSGIEPFLDAVETVLMNPAAILRENGKTWMSIGLRGMEPADIWPMMQSLSIRHAGRVSGSGFVQPSGGGRAYVNPIPVRGSKPAYLVLLERDREITTLDTFAMERLSALAGLEMANMDAVREVEGKYLELFLQDWLSGKIPTESDWKRRAEISGCSLTVGTPLCAVQVGWPVPGPSPEKLHEYTRRLRTERLRGTDGLLAAPSGKSLALIVPMPSANLADGEGAIDRMLLRLLAELRPFLEDRDIRLYAGKIAQGPEGVHGSWLQAMRTRQIAEICGMKEDYLSYGKLGAYSLLFMIPSGTEREQFLQRYFHPLRQADHKGGGRLAETLEMFFRCNGNIKLTSEKLSAHYNTVVYRLEKIQTLLGISLDNAEDRLQVQLAIKLGKIPVNSNV